MKNLPQAYLEVSLRVPIDDLKVKQRLDRAYGILNDYGYEVIPDVHHTGVYEVRKASTSMLEDTSAVYHTSSQLCNCPDYPTARGNLCKHRLAVMLVEEMNA